ncbi:MAG: ribonuclease D [Acidimicrobiales bacterium]
MGGVGLEGGAVATSGSSPPALVADAPALAALVATLSGVDRYALDTEFHRERTYWPRLALVQLAWTAPGTDQVEIALVDPLAVDVAPLAAVLGGPATMVAHAAEQDLEVLERACGRGPARLLDTQVAAGFAGAGSASLANLAASYLGVAMAKGDRLTDWNRRPLGESQLAYAAADVAHLLALAAALEADLAARGRLGWATEECQGMLRRSRGPGEPERAWWKLRDCRQLRGSARGVAQELAAWRERRARHLDLPPRMVVPDLALQAMASHPPATHGDLGQVRGMDGRHRKGGLGEEILAAVRRGRSLAPSEIVAPPTDEVARDLRPAVALAAAWVGQVARDEEVDATLLATRADLVAALRGDPGARLASGWRLGMVGRPLRALTQGHAALAFAGAGRLVLEERSSRPLGGGIGDRRQGQDTSS